MKLRNILLNLTVGFAALFFGLAWVGVYNYFLGDTLTHGQHCFSSRMNLENTERLNFDINDPESVLPIDFEEDKLSDPKSDENNAESFDAEGTYFPIEKVPAEFKAFEAFIISNKTLNYDENGSYNVKDVAPEGYVYGNYRYEFENIEIKNGKINFQTKTNDGVSFNFEGEFLVKGNFYTLDPDAEVIKGNLIKNIGNKKIVLQDVTFGWMIDFEFE